MKKSKMKSENSGNAIRIEGGMTIVRALELKQILLDSMEQSPNVEIDLSAVSEIDTAGVQLLILAKITALAKQCELRLMAHSPAVVEMFELLDLASYFGDPLVMQAPVH